MENQQTKHKKIQRNKKKLLISFRFEPNRSDPIDCHECKHFHRFNIADAECLHFTQGAQQISFSIEMICVRVAIFLYPVPGPHPIDPNCRIVVLFFSFWYKENGKYNFFFSGKTIFSNQMEFSFD